MPLGSSWLKRSVKAVTRLAAGSNTVFGTTFFTFVFYVHGAFTFMVKIMLSHPLLYAWETCGATLTTTL